MRSRLKPLSLTPLRHYERNRERGHETCSPHQRCENSRRKMGVPARSVMKRHARKCRSGPQYQSHPPKGSFARLEIAAQSSARVVRRRSVQTILCSTHRNCVCLARVDRLFLRWAMMMMMMMIREIDFCARGAVWASRCGPALVRGPRHPGCQGAGLFRTILGCFRAVRLLPRRHAKRLHPNTVSTSFLGTSSLPPPCWSYRWWAKTIVGTIVAEAAAAMLAEECTHLACQSPSAAAASATSVAGARGAVGAETVTGRAERELEHTQLPGLCARGRTCARVHVGVEARACAFGMCV